MVARYVPCRVCDVDVPVWDWKRHIEDHKRDFCRRLLLDPKYWFEVSWNNVVKYFKPDSVRLVGGDERVVRKPRDDQVSLDNFLK